MINSAGSNFHQNFRDFANSAIAAFSSFPLASVSASITSWRLYPFSTSLRITGSGKVAACAPLAPPWAEKDPELDDCEIEPLFDEAPPLTECPWFWDEEVNVFVFLESLLLVFVFEPPGKPKKDILQFNFVKILN